MKQLEQTITSLEVATMVGKDHKNIIRDIRGYSENLNELKIEPVNFFTESTYKDNKGEIRPCFNVTKKGCEFIAHKLTGIKGTEFTAKYINRFHDMEDTIKEGIPQSKDDRIRIMEMNARTRMAQTYLKLAQVDTISATYKSIIVAKATEVLAGEKLLPEVKSKKTYTATEIGNMLNITSCKVGRIANENNLKTEQYGEYIRDKSKYSSREVDTWVYFDTVIPEFEKILGGKTA